MSEVQITSARNETILAFRALGERKGRAEQRAYLLEGPKLVEEALAGGLLPQQALVDAGAAQADAWCRRLQASGVPTLVCKPHAFAAAADTQSPQCVLARMPLPEYRLAGGVGRVLALDGLQDPGNVGTIWRTAEAAGFGALLLGQGCADPFAPKTVRASMGAVLRVPVEVCPGAGELAARLAALRDDGYAVAVTALDGEPFFSARPREGNIVLVIGSEGAGISPSVAEAATHRLRLPMAGQTESLNAAVAAGIMMYTFFMDGGE